MSSTPMASLSELRSPLSPLGTKHSMSIPNVSQAATVFPSHVRRFFKRDPKDYTGELVRLLDDMATQTHAISTFVAEGSETVTYGAVREEKLTAESVTRLIYRSLSHDGYACMVLAKGFDEPLVFPEGVPQGGYVVCLSALDADPRSHDHFVCGTIFCVFKRKSAPATPGQLIDLQQELREQVAAGFVTYGASTVLYYTLGHGLYSFVLHPVALQYFLQPDSRLVLRDHGPVVYGKRTIVSEDTPLGRGLRRYMRTTDNCKMFHTGCLAGNAALLLPNGGAMIKPDARLLTEAAPLAFIIEQAGGIATDGHGKRILDMKVGEEYNAKVCFVAGVESVVREIERLSYESSAKHDKADADEAHEHEHDDDDNDDDSFDDAIADANDAVDNVTAANDVTYVDSVPEDERIDERFAEQ